MPVKSKNKKVLGLYFVYFFIPFSSDSFHCIYKSTGPCYIRKQNKKTGPSPQKV